MEDIDEEENLHFQANPDAHPSSRITTQRMMSEQVEPDAFEPPCHIFKLSSKAKCEGLLKEYESQIPQDDTSIGMTPLTKMTMDTGSLSQYSKNPI